MTANKMYIISGKHRREVKKELHELKRFVKNFWYYHQLDKDMAGFCVMSDEQAQEKYDQAVSKIAGIEAKLSLKP